VFIGGYGGKKSLKKKSNFILEGQLLPTGK
jgi:hypothetical protein